jgi:hypothetical protein
VSSDIGPIALLRSIIGIMPDEEKPVPLLTVLITDATQTA